MGFRREDFGGGETPERGGVVLGGGQKRRVLVWWGQRRRSKGAQASRQVNTSGYQERIRITGQKSQNRVFAAASRAVVAGLCVWQAHAGVSQHRRAAARKRMYGMYVMCCCVLSSSGWRGRDRWCVAVAGVAGVAGVVVVVVVVARFALSQRAEQEAGRV